MKGPTPILGDRQQVAALLAALGYGNVCGRALVSRVVGRPVATLDALDDDEVRRVLLALRARIAAP